jgi:RNA polymerase sigma-70 factor, ECF subfamily
MQVHTRPAVNHCVLVGVHSDAGNVTILACEAVPVSPEEQLMRALHAEHADVLFAFVMRYVDDRERAEDVVQETLLRAWRTLDGIDPRRGSPRSYLFTVARNVLTDMWRAEERRPRLVHDEEAMAAVPSPDDVEQAVEGLLVAEALGRLSPEHRGVVQALYYDGQSVAEAARQLGLPEGTVKSRAFYAVRALRSAFEEMGVVR